MDEIRFDGRVWDFCWESVVNVDVEFCVVYVVVECFV